MSDVATTTSLLGLMPGGQLTGEGQTGHVGDDLAGGTRRIAVSSWGAHGGGHGGGGRDQSMEILCMLLGKGRTLGVAFVGTAQGDVG